MRTILEVKNLTKTYSKKTVVDRLNFKVGRGEIFALLGNNGAGKTTTIKMLTGLTKPTSGVIKYYNKSFDAYKKELLMQIGCVLENPGFYENLTVFENLQLITNIVGLHKPGYMDELLALVKLTESKYTMIHKLSNSDKQKLAIVKALLNNPSVLILDEPLNGLDTLSINEIRTLLLRLSREKNTTIFISSHILSEIDKIADRVAIIHGGSIIDVFEHKKLQENQSKQIIINFENEILTAKLLNRENISYDIIGKNKMALMTHLSISDIIDLFVKESVPIHEVYYKTYNLEGYFLDLIKKQGVTRE